MSNTVLPTAVSAAASGGNGLLGEIVAWTFPRASEWSQADVAAALIYAGLGKHVPRKLAARWAFQRAVNKLRADGLIREVKISTSEITFQLTAETLDASLGELVYRLVAKVTLDLSTGAISSTDPLVQQKSEWLFLNRLETRTVLDVSRLILSMCAGNADLYPIKAQSGVYFIPSAQTGFCDGLQRFADRLGGHLIRFPVPDGGTVAPQSVALVMQDLAHSDVAEYEAAMAALRGTVDARTVKAAVAAVRQAENRLVGLRMFVESTLTRLEDDAALVAYHQKRLPGVDS